MVLRLTDSNQKDFEKREIPKRIRDLIGRIQPLDTEAMSKAKEKGEIERRLRRLIQSRCEDVNVHLLIRAALYLDDELAEDRVEVEGDPVNLLCDEFLGMSIAEYIGGKSALFNYVRYDMRKPGVLSELGVFLDDVIAGLITGCMTRLF